MIVAEPHVGKIVKMIAGPNGKRTLIIEPDVGAGDAQGGALRAGPRTQRRERDSLAEMRPYEAIIATGKPAAALTTAQIVGKRSWTGIVAVGDRRTDGAGVRGACCPLSRSLAGSDDSAPQTAICR